MINYDDNETSILSFYNIKEVSLSRKKDLNLSRIESIDVDSVNDMSDDDKLNLLGRLISYSQDDQRNSPFVYDNDDMEDPLRGRGSNVAKQLLSEGIIKSVDDPKLGQFLITSQNYNPFEFLKVLHRDSSMDDLAYYLNYLERSIQSQTAQLKLVVNENFSGFVGCKKSIDDVLSWFKEQKTHSQKVMESSTVFNPQRHKKNAHDESLVSLLEESINNVNMATSLVIRPIMDHKNKEMKIARVIDFVKTHEFFFDLPRNLIQYILSQNHQQFISDYHKYLKEKKRITSDYQQKAEKFQAVSSSTLDKNTLESWKMEQYLFNTLLSKVFREIDNVATEYRRKINAELLNLDDDVDDVENRLVADNTKFISLVDKLYELNINDNSKSNPIYEFMKTLILGLMNDLDYQLSKTRSKFDLMQHKLKQYVRSLDDLKDGGSNVKNIKDKYNSVHEYLNSSSFSSLPSGKDRDKVIVELFDNSENLDFSYISESWLILSNYFEYLDTTFMNRLSKFVNNYKHYNDNQTGFNVDQSGNLRNIFFKLITKLSSELNTIFVSENEDGNLLESSRDDYGNFLPYYANSLSSVYYLTNISKKIDDILTRAGGFVAIVGNISKSTDSNKIIKMLRSVYSSTSQKILEGICVSWINDCSQFYEIENWEKYNPVSEEKDEVTYTKTIDIFQCYETFILHRLSEMIFSKNQNTLDESVRIVSAYPSKRILVSVEIQFMRSLNIFLDSLMKKYASDNQNLMKNNNLSSDIFKILTMNNFDVLSRKIYPSLIRSFDVLFQKDLLQQKMKLYADIDKATLTILDDILRREKAFVDEIVSNHFVSVKIRDTNSSGELRVDGFVYVVLVHLVKLVHTVRPLTGDEIFINIVNEIQQYFLQTTLESLRLYKSAEASEAVLNNLHLGTAFFVEVFDTSANLKLNELSMKYADLLLEATRSNARNGVTNTQFEQALVKYLTESESEFDCF